MEVSSAEIPHRCGRLGGAMSVGSRESEVGKKQRKEESCDVLCVCGFREEGLD